MMHKTEKHSLRRVISAALSAAMLLAAAPFAYAAEDKAYASYPAAGEYRSYTSFNSFSKSAIDRTQADGWGQVPVVGDECVTEVTAYVKNDGAQYKHSYEPYQTADGDTALKFTAKIDPGAKMDLYNAPLLDFRPGYIGESDQLYYQADIKILSADTDYESAVMICRMQDGGYPTAERIDFNSDGSIKNVPASNANFEYGKWYTIKRYYDAAAGYVSTSLTDLETGAVQELGKQEYAPNQVPGLRLERLAFVALGNSSFVIDNVYAGAFEAEGILSPAANAKISETEGVMHVKAKIFGADMVMAQVDGMPVYAWGASNDGVYETDLSLNGFAYGDHTLSIVAGDTVLERRFVIQNTVGKYLTKLATFDFGGQTPSWNADWSDYYSCFDAAEAAIDSLNDAICNSGDIHGKVMKLGYDRTLYLTPRASGGEQIKSGKMVFEADMKTETNHRVNFETVGMSWNTLLDVEAGVGRSNTMFPLNEWFHVKLVFDYDNMVYDVYYNGNNVLSQYSVQGDYLNASSNTLKFVSFNGDVMFDNMVLYRPSDKSVELNAGKSSVKAFSDTVTVAVDNPGFTAATAVLYSDGAVIGESSAWDVQNSQITFNLSEKLPVGTALSVEFTKESTGLDRNLKFDLNAEAPSYTVVANKRLSYENGEASAVLDIYSPEEGNVNIGLAVYDNEGALCDVLYDKTTLSAGMNVGISKNLSALGESAKCFVWTDDMKPVSEK